MRVLDEGGSLVGVDALASYLPVVVYSIRNINSVTEATDHDHPPPNQLRSRRSDHRIPGLTTRMLNPRIILNISLFM